MHYRFFNNEIYDYDNFEYNDNYDEKIIDNISNNLKKINHSIKGNCGICNDGYILNSDNKCAPMTIENCSIFSMIKNDLSNGCEAFCRLKKYTLIVLNLNNTDNNISYITISEIYREYRYFTLLNEFKSLINQTLCVDNSDNSKFNYLKNCIIAFYLEKEDKYLCNVCDDGYYLYKEENKCIKYDENNCDIENIGNKTNPIFSCNKCPPKFYSYSNYYSDYYYNYRYNHISYYDNDYPSSYMLVKEGNISLCVFEFEPDLINCSSADVNTTYINNKYNCASCLINHLSYYSEFYERYICQNIFEKTKTSQNIDLDNFKYYDNIEAIDGECPNNTFFTPDGKFCYRCSNSYIGMEGCNSQCIFSFERNDMLKCLDGCKDGYIESSEGICKSCYNVNSGCNKCHYENEYPTNYFGIKRKRKFICDNCDSNYYVKIDDKCVSCSNIENGCNVCQFENNEFKCLECVFNYILDDERNCKYCSGIISEIKCIECNDVKQGGIEGCNSCNRYDNKTSCSFCEEGYILLTNNGTCLKIIENEELKKHNQCQKITLQNNIFKCLECRDYRFSVLKENNEAICIYLPELNGYVDNNYYDNKDLYHYEKNPDIDYIYKYYYNFYISHYFSHCVEVINLGTKDKPLYSCTKCYYSYYLVTEERTNISYCIYYYNVDNYEDMNNCNEKKIKIWDKGIKYTCSQCEKDYIRIYHEIDKVYYCKNTTQADLSDTLDTFNISDLSDTLNTFNESDKICMAKNCKICKLDDNYFCDICEFEDYVVNDVTGACMKRSKAVPAITWKDIFRLEMNSVKEINGKKIYGPKLHLKGITHSKINSGHAFLIYLTFKIKQPLRNLDNSNDTIRIRTICEVIEEVEENKNEVNSVEYECIGDSNGTDLTDYTLFDIDVGDDKSNLKELKSSKDLSQIDNKNIILFIMKATENNQTSNNYNFDFKIDGKIDSNLSETEINENLTMNEINEPSNCRFIIEKDKKANLICALNIKKHKNIKLLTFNTTKISYDQENSISLDGLKEVYLINEAEPIFKNLYNRNNKKNNKTGIIVGTIVSVLVIAILAIITTYICYKRKSKANASNERKAPSNIDQNYNKTSDSLNTVI